MRDRGRERKTEVAMVNDLKGDERLASSQSFLLLCYDDYGYACCSWMMMLLLDYKQETLVSKDPKAIERAYGEQRREGSWRERG
jgi:hypothetical protein